MKRIGFTMYLLKGFAEEYARRHASIWPELKALLTETGIQEYSIFLDESTLVLFAFLHVKDEAALDNLPSNPIMQRWWAYMGDIMQTNADGSPVSTPMKEVFYLP